MLSFKVWLEDEFGFSANNAPEFNNSNADMSAKGIRSKFMPPEANKEPKKSINPEKMFFGKGHKTKKGMNHVPRNHF